MHGKQMSGHALLDAWREQGADRRNPLAFHYLVALQRRVSNHDGDVRHVLEDKLSGLVQAYADELERTASSAGGVAHTTLPARTSLGEVVDDLAHRSALRNGDDMADVAARCAALPELPVLNDVRKIWDNVLGDSQARRSLQHSPTNAGPLNSSGLVHRSLTLMRELSPGYLQQFLSYVDALSWLDQMHDGGVLAAKDATHRDSSRPRARGKPRKRRE